MRTVVVLAAAAATWLAPAGASAEPLSGEVVRADSRWTASGDRIVTDLTIETDDGRRATVRQLGGTVGGIGMRVIPAPPIARPGDRVHARRAGGLIHAVDRAAPPDLNGPVGTIPFVRTTASETGAPLFWESGCVFITFDSAGTSHIPGSEELAVMQQVLDTWQSETASCSYLQLVVDEPAEVEVGFDRMNVVKFRDSTWCRPERGDDPMECYDDSAAGLTTLFFIDDASSKRNGAILDADVELNAVNFAISVNGETEGRQGCMSDLANTFTHEIGHLLGLDHTCWVGGTRPVDDTGELVPSCSGDLSSEITEATMYNFQECGETKKASLEADDIAGVCAIYPIADDPNECKPVGEGGGCCSATTGDDPPWQPALLAVLCLAILARPRRRARARIPSRRDARNR